eukprot:Pgem_evm2s4553
MSINSNMSKTLLYTNTWDLEEDNMLETQADTRSQTKLNPCGNMEGHYEHVHSISFVEQNYNSKAKLKKVKSKSNCNKQQAISLCLKVFNVALILIALTIVGVVGYNTYNKNSIQTHVSKVKSINTDLRATVENQKQTIKKQNIVIANLTKSSESLMCITEGVDITFGNLKKFVIDFDEFNNNIRYKIQNVNNELVDKKTKLKTFNSNLEELKLNLTNVENELQEMNSNGRRVLKELNNTNTNDNIIDNNTHDNNVNVKNINVTIINNENKAMEAITSVNHSLADTNKRKWDTARRLKYVRGVSKLVSPFSRITKETPKKFEETYTEILGSMCGENIPEKYQFNSTLANMYTFDNVYDTCLQYCSLK